MAAIVGRQLLGNAGKALGTVQQWTPLLDTLRLTGRSTYVNVALGSCDVSCPNSSREFIVFVDKLLRFFNTVASETRGIRRLALKNPGGLSTLLRCRQK
jgi:hypothetical protein